MSKSILVCGGAGYIGSHMVRLLVEQGFEPVVLDDLSTGHREAVGAAVVKAAISRTREFAADAEAARDRARTLSSTRSTFSVPGNGSYPNFSTNCSM